MPNEAVQKADFEASMGRERWTSASYLCQVVYGSSFGDSSQLGKRLPLLAWLSRISMMRELLDVVHQAVELPLRIAPLLLAQREPAQPLVVAQVTKHRLHRRNPSALWRLPL